VRERARSEQGKIQKQARLTFQLGRVCLGSVVPLHKLMREARVTERATVTLTETTHHINPEVTTKICPEETKDRTWLTIEFYDKKHYRVKRKEAEPDTFGYFNRK